MSTTKFFGPTTTPTRATTGTSTVTRSTSPTHGAGRNTWDRATSTLTGSAKTHGTGALRRSLIGGGGTATQRLSVGRTRTTPRRFMSTSATPTTIERSGR